MNVPGLTPEEIRVRTLLRRTLSAFRAGAELSREDIKRLAAARGITLSNNQLRELSRGSDRSSGVTLELLYAVISQWADEQTSAVEGGDQRASTIDTHD